MASILEWLVLKQKIQKLIDRFQRFLFFDFAKDKLS